MCKESYTKMWSWSYALKNNSLCIGNLLEFYYTYSDFLVKMGCWNISKIFYVKKILTNDKDIYSSRDNCIFWLKHKQNKKYISIVLRTEKRKVEKMEEKEKGIYFLDFYVRSTFLMPKLWSMGRDGLKPLIINNTLIILGKYHPSSRQMKLFLSQSCQKLT